MIGKNQIEILNADMLIKGMSTSEDISDGGFSPTTPAINLLNSPGVLYFPDAVTDIDTDIVLTDEVVASSSCNETFAETNAVRRVVTADRKYYEFDGTKLGAVLRTGAAGHTYDFFTQMVQWSGEIIVNTRETLVRWDEAGGMFNEDFLDFSGVDGAIDPDTVPHPILVFENNLYTAVGHLLLRSTTVGTAPTIILTLGIRYIITALGVDPSTGKMLIAISSLVNASGTFPADNKLLWYDGFSNKVLKSIEVESLITAFNVHQGIVFVGYGRNLGYLTGNGIQFLRKLKNVTYNSSDLLYKRSFASIGNTLCVIDGNQVLAYGEIIPGRKTFYYIYSNQIATTTTKFQHIFDAGQEKLGISVAGASASKLHTLDINTVASSSSVSREFDTNWFRFLRPIIPTLLLIEFDGAINTSNLANVFYQAETDSTLNSNLLGVKNTSTSTRVAELIGFLNERITAIRFNVTIDSGNPGIRRAILYFNYVE